MRQALQATAIVALVLGLLAATSYLLRQPIPTPIPNIIIDQADNTDLDQCRSEVARLDAKLAEHRAYVAAMKVWLADNGYQVSATGEITDAASGESLPEAEAGTPPFDRESGYWEQDTFSRRGKSRWRSR